MDESAVPAPTDMAAVEWNSVPTSVRAAVERALARRQREALAEVEQILDAALRVAERAAPADPRVADIVAEAGMSNNTFYRYFAGKQDLMVAVMERGVARLRGYLERRMAAYDNPAEQVAAWVDGLLAQLTHPSVGRQSMAVSRQVGPGDGGPGGSIVLDQLGDLLVEPLTRAARPEPALDARALQDAVLGSLRRHVWQGSAPTEDERAHLVGFCVDAVFPRRSGRAPASARVPATPRGRR